MTERKRDTTIYCPVCDGEGVVVVGIPKPQDFSRDVGLIDEEVRHCERCDGRGEIRLNEGD